MKTLLLPLAVCCAALLPFAQVNAANPADVKLYGGFPKGMTFTFKVMNVTSAKADIIRGTIKASVPNGIPKFKKGQNVTFTIGTKGALTGPGFSISFDRLLSATPNARSAGLNIYVGRNTFNEQAFVYKNSKEMPKSVFLRFRKQSGDMSTSEVTYTLK